MAPRGAGFGGINEKIEKDTPKWKGLNDRKPTYCAEDLYRIDLISSPRLSPDGRYVIYSQSRSTARARRNIPICGGLPPRLSAPQQFTFGNQNDGTMLVAG